MNSSLSCFLNPHHDDSISAPLICIGVQCHPLPLSAAALSLEPVASSEGGWRQQARHQRGSQGGANELHFNSFLAKTCCLRNCIQLQGLLLGSLRAALRRAPSPEKHHVSSQSGWGGVAFCHLGSPWKQPNTQAPRLPVSFTLAPWPMCEWQRAFCLIIPTARPLTSLRTLMVVGCKLLTTN